MSNDQLINLVLEMAPSFQGGHSKTGGKIAELLGVPFPLRMSNLKSVARNRGLDPAVLWPAASRSSRWGIGNG